MQLIEALGTGIDRARGGNIAANPPPEIVAPVKEALETFAGKYDGVQLVPSDRGIVVGQVLEPEARGTVLWEQLTAHRVSGIYIPAWIRETHLWRLLVVTSMDARRIMQAGGLEVCLERAECSVVRVHLLPAPQNEETLPFAPLPELEEIQQRLAEPRSGDTVEQLPMKRSRNASERAAAYKRLTREIVRAFASDGPDATARALILTWRRLSTMHTRSSEAGLDTSSVVAVLHRVDPLTRFAVLAQLGYTTEGKKIGGQIADADLVESIAAAVTWQYRGGHTACLAVLRTARMGALERQPILAAIRQHLQDVNLGDDAMWAAVEESSAAD